MPREAALPALLLGVALAAPARPAEVTGDMPAKTSAYREAVERANDVWRARPRLTQRSEAACVEAWQGGDRVRTMLQGATPPAAFAAYHAAVLECVEASLAVSDECLLKPPGGPNWGAYFRTASTKCMAVIKLVQAGRLALPTRWYH